MEILQDAELKYSCPRSVIQGFTENQENDEIVKMNFFIISFIISVYNFQFTSSSTNQVKQFK